MRGGERLVWEGVQTPAGGGSSPPPPLSANFLPVEMRGGGGEGFPPPLPPLERGSSEPPLPYPSSSHTSLVKGPSFHAPPGSWLHRILYSRLFIRRVGFMLYCHFITTQEFVSISVLASLGSLSDIIGIKPYLRTESNLQPNDHM